MIALPFPVPWLILGAIAGGSFFAGYRSASNAAEEAAKEAALVAFTRATKLQNETNEMAARYQETIANAEKELAKLRADIKSGAVRLRIKTSSCLPTNPSAPGGANGPGTADIDAGVAESLTGITGKGDAAIRKLAALQKWVKSVCLAPGQKT